MPELPDLLYLRERLIAAILGKIVRGVTVKQPVVIRNAVNRPFAEALANRRIDTITVHGPFLNFSLEGRLHLVVNLMLAGRLHLQAAGERPAGHLCLSLALDDGWHLNLCDEQKMAKVYLLEGEDYRAVPKYREQGIDVLSPAFTVETFRDLARLHGRKQVRVFINDHTILSSIGNAYADEILFDAGIHPKTFVRQLDQSAVDRLFHSITTVLQWGVQHVERAGRPTHVKVREHMKVRNRKGKPCPRCGTTIRREGVRGHDVFFCPACQPASRKLFLDWNTRR